MKYLLNIIIALFFSLSLLGHASAQIFVKQKPQKPKVLVVKTTKPGPSHKWIGGHWKVQKNKYTWSSGYWVKASKHNVWIPGRWKEEVRGWKWIPGHWRNLRRR